jgi:hypothetical protein
MMQNALEIGDPDITPTTNMVRFEHSQERKAEVERRDKSVDNVQDSTGIFVKSEHKHGLP